MIILGLDPGLASTGFGIVSVNNAEPRLIRCGCVKTSAGMPMPERLSQIFADMKEVLLMEKPDITAIENAYSLVRYPKAGIILGAVLGVLHLLMVQNQIPVVEISPKEMKNALAGYGSAGKNQIKSVICKALNVSDIKSFHAADALGVALAAYYRNPKVLRPS